MKQEECWATIDSKNLNKGKKIIYRCNHATYIGKQCAAQTYSLSKFAPEDTEDHGKFILFWNGCEHTHKDLPNQTKVVPQYVRKKIIELHNGGKTPMPISFALRGMNDIPLKDQPSIDVIKNTIAAYKSEKYGSDPITMEDIKKFVDEHLEVPDDLELVHLPRRKRIILRFWSQHDA